jgi:hypothetical protein
VTAWTDNQRQQGGERMASDEWWTVDDPAVFGPVTVEVKVGEIPRHQGDYLYARWESESSTSSRASSAKSRCCS